jgi:hypothetical protein
MKLILIAYKNLGVLQILDYLLDTRFKENFQYQIERSEIGKMIYYLFNSIEWLLFS